MIIGSIALVVFAAVVWIIGIWENSDLWYYASIVSSVLAAFALLVGVRQRVRARIPVDDFDVDPRHVPDALPVVPRPTGRAAIPRTPVADPPAAESPAADPSGWWGRRREAADAGGSTATAVPARSARGLSGSESTVDPPDEPPAELITQRQSRRIATMTAEVVVIDGRPRFHEAGCLHLLGRDAERLPVDEAIQLGFTPCGQCQPARGLLATSPR